MPNWSQEELDRIAGLKALAAEEKLDAEEGSAQIDLLLPEAASNDAIYKKVVEEAIDFTKARIQDIIDSQSGSITGTWTITGWAGTDDGFGGIIPPYTATITLSTSWTSNLTLDNIFTNATLVGSSIVPDTTDYPGMTFEYDTSTTIIATYSAAGPVGTDNMSSSVDYIAVYNTGTSEFWDYDIYNETTNPTAAAKRLEEEKYFPELQDYLTWNSVSQPDGPKDEIDVRQNMTVKDGVYGWKIHIKAANGSAGQAILNYDTIDQTDKDYIDEQKAILDGAYSIREKELDGVRFVYANLEFAQAAADDQAAFAQEKSDYLNTL